MGELFADYQILTIVLTAVTVILSSVIMYLLTRSKQSKDAVVLSEPKLSIDGAMDLIQKRRTILPKDYLPVQDCGPVDVTPILEAARWAPTHKHTEPWHFVILEGPMAILGYLDFLSDYYDENSNDIPEDQIQAFRKKISSVRGSWPERCSHVIMICLKRHDDKLPEWEEICAVACAVQNMHLMATAMGDVGGFWSSHTWCRHARDSGAMRKHLKLSNDGDRVFGAFCIGKYDVEKTEYKSRREELTEKMEVRKS